MFVRILTENRNYEDVVKLVLEYFDGATIIKAEGVSRGQREHSLIIEIDIRSHSDSADYYEDLQKIKKFVYALKKMNDQKEVLIQYITCESKME